MAYSFVGRYPTQSWNSSHGSGKVAAPQTPMKKLTNSLIAILLLTLGISSRADVLIDSFATSQSAPGGVSTVNVADGPGILGGERDVQSFLQLSANGAVPGQLQISAPNGAAGGDLIYAGIHQDPYTSSFSGLGSVDLTQEGINNCFQFDITSVGNTPATLLIQLRSLNHGSNLQLNLPQTPGLFDVPFSSFLPAGNSLTYPIDFRDVGYIDFHFEMGGGGSIAMDSIIATTIPEPASLAMFSAFSLGFLVLRGRKK
jgi:hypothetical protein